MGKNSFRTSKENMQTFLSFHTHFSWPDFTHMSLLQATPEVQMSGIQEEGLAQDGTLGQALRARALAVVSHVETPARNRYR